MKQFATEQDFREWFNKRFYSNITVEEMLLGTRVPSDDDIIAALITDGYTDLDNLLANGHDYQIGSHTNNGWLYVDEADIDYIEREKRDVELRVRESKIKEARTEAGLSRAEMSRQFEIPIRTLENWESGIRKPPIWAEKLIVEKLCMMKGENL